MKSVVTIFLCLLFNSFFCQNKFEMNISAKLFEKDSLFISPFEYSKYSEMVIHTNDDVKYNNQFSSATAKVNNGKTIVSGVTKYPILVNISYYDPKINGGYVSKPFIIENLKYVIYIKDKFLEFDLESKSSANKDFQNIENLTKNITDKLLTFQNNDPKFIVEKQKTIRNLIKKDPGSFGAFWVIVNDYSRFGFNNIYLENLKLFSKKIKDTKAYKEFLKDMKIENSTEVGGNLPTLKFDNANQISKVDFQNYQLTLIDYWATSCKPCIEDLPKLVKLYNKYKEKGINFISVADENEKQKKDLANKILTENKVTWKNYFDVNKEFPKKLNSKGYPLQILVDSNGKIVEKKYGGLEDIIKLLEKY